jgi:hypothetical protein
MRGLFRSFSVASLLLLAFVAIASADRIPHRRPTPPANPVRQDTAFHNVPDSKLDVRAVQYDGSTNGRLVVQVKNTGKAAQKFSAKGLYFVPEGDPDSAPQRLGAVGPMQMVADPEHKELSELEVAPGATVEVALDVFCIDSHRGSPSSGNRFNVGAKRLPRELSQTIETRANAAVDEERASGNKDARPAAKGKIQSEVWRSRDSKWIELDGEGKQEAAKAKH